MSDVSPHDFATELVRKAISLMSVGWVFMLQITTAFGTAPNAIVRVEWSIVIDPSLLTTSGA